MFSRLAVLCAVAAGLTQGAIAGPVTSIFATEAPVATTVDSSEPSGIAVASSSILDAAPSSEPTTIVFSSAEPSSEPTTIVFSSAASSSPTTIEIEPSGSEGITSVFFPSASSSVLSSEPTTITITDSPIGSVACPSIGASTVTVTVTAVAASFTTLEPVGTASSLEAVTITAA